MAGEFICQDCGREFEKEWGLRVHMRKHGSQSDEVEEIHPEQPEQPEQPESSAPGPVKKPASDMLEKLRMSGVEPEEIISAFQPLVETSVVQVLEKLQFGEAINKRMADVETNLTAKLNQVLEPLQQAVQSGGPGGGNSQGNTQLRDTVIAAVAQKILGGGDSAGSLTAQLSKLAELLKSTREIAQAFNAPYVEGRNNERKELNDLVSLMGKLGATPTEIPNLLKDQIKREG